MTDAPVDPFQAARANLRDTIKWLSGALAGVVTVAVGSAPLTSVGTMKHDDPRLWIAGICLLVALMLFLVAIGMIFAVLTTDVFLIESAIDGNALRDARFNPVVAPVLPVGETFPEFCERYRDAQANYVAQARDPTSPAYAAERQHLLALVPFWSSVTSLLHLETFRDQVHGLRLPLFGTTVAGVMALAVFAWAANPPKPQPAPVQSFQLIPGSMVTVVVSSPK